MKPKFFFCFFFYAFLVAVIFSSSAYADEKQRKEGWEKITVYYAVEGCTMKVVSSNVAAYERRGKEDGKNASEKELEIVREFLTGQIRPFCQCIIDECSRLYGYKEFSETLPKRDPDFMKRIMDSGKCMPVYPSHKNIEAFKKKVRALKAKESPGPH